MGKPRAFLKSIPFPRSHLTVCRMQHVLWVMLGGALGSASRYGISLWLAHHPQTGFPWSTLLVNAVGSLMIGLAFEALGPDGRWPASLEIRNFLMVGLLGGFTTYSSFSLQTLVLIQNEIWSKAAWNIISTFAVCLLGCWVGLKIGKTFLTAA